jgi:hypothetical protein
VSFQFENSAVRHSDVSALKVSVGPDFCISVGVTDEKDLMRNWAEMVENVRICKVFEEGICRTYLNVPFSVGKLHRHLRI